VLAEKWRPQTFDAVIGQPKVIKRMAWHIGRAGENGSGLAFLLTGPSGSGKTTLAFCAARAFGVDEYHIQKIESAECSVDRLRDLANHAYFYGGGAKGRKCYIIDEIHTLGQRSLDRLLSLLEELPAHVLLIGTTTVDNWTDGTLLSRWNRFDLSKVPSADVAAHLEHVAVAEGLPIPSDPQWAAKMVKYNGLNIRDLLNQLPDKLLDMEPETVAA